MATLSTPDGRTLNLFHWTATGTPEVLVLALIHGYGEHAGRYAHLAERLGKRGISVVAADLRGHGKSSGARGHVERFEEYHTDAKAILDAAKERANGHPVALMGHSMGGLVVSHWLLNGGGRGVAGVVLSSPYLGLALEVPAAKVLAGKVMSRLLPGLGLESGLKGSDVTRDPELARIYDTDPLNNKKATARWFTEATKAIDEVHTRAAELSAPMLLLYGGADRVASADATDRFKAKLRGPDVTAERLADHYHELVNEPQAVRDAVMDRIGTWLLARA